jgi:hypothetical protein
MGNLQSLTDATRNVQDAQYIRALQGMTPEQRTSYFASQKTQFVNNLLDERESAFQKTYTDMIKNTNVQHSLLYYKARNSDVDEIGKQMDNKNKATENTAIYNKQLAERQYEINEWTNNNKQETLFVFQLLFITLLVVSLFAFLQRLGYFSNLLFGALTGLLLFLVAATIANRANYTNRIRGKRYWNKKDTTRTGGGSSGDPNICPQ